MAKRKPKPEAKQQDQKPPAVGGNLAEQLAAATKSIGPSEVAVDDLPTVVDMTATLQEDEKYAQDAGKASEWVKSTLTWLDTYERGNRAQKDRFADEATKYRKALDGLLSHRNTTIRRAAWLALFKVRFSQTNLTNHDEVAALLGEMVRTGLLMTTGGDGDLPGGKNAKGQSKQVYGKKYVFPSKASFEEKDITEVQQLFKELMTRVWSCVREAWAKKYEDFETKGSHDLSDLVEGKPGDYVVTVPSDPKPDNATGSLEGGRVLVHSDGKKIVIVDVVNEVHGWGNFERNVLMAKELKVHLLVDSLGWSNPPFIKGLPKEQNSKVRLLWFAFKRAMEDGKETTPLDREQ